jgi:TonB family protein
VKRWAGASYAAFVISVPAFVAALSLCTGRAAASVEFCPAVLGNMSPIGAALGTAATVYSYELTALAPRSVDATLVADTSAGWFGWSVTGVDLKRTTRFFRSSGAKLTRYNVTLAPVTIPYPVAASSPLSVAFPLAVTVRHAWVVRARGSDASAYGKDASAAFPCSVPDFFSADMADPAPVYPGGFATPSPLSSPVAPAPRAAPTLPPFAPPTCKTPFAEATVTHPVQPEAPMAAREEGAALTAVVEVAVGKDGTLLDDWILGSSGSRAFDLSVLRAARASQYSKPVSYCQPVNGLYLFRADFLPD